MPTTFLFPGEFYRQIRAENFLNFEILWSSLTKHYAGIQLLLLQLEYTVEYGACSIASTEHALEYVPERKITKFSHHLQ